MATLHQQVADKFIAKLAVAGAIEPEMIDQLRKLLTSNKKLKAEDLVKLFEQPMGGDVK
jgi:hypothetical protein